MVRTRGFTLLELVVVVAIVGILASLAIPAMRAGRRNATVGQAALELQMRVEQLQFVALSEQLEHLLVIVDVPGNDARLCGSILSSGCARVFHLRAPTANWKLANFDVDSPATEVGTVVDEDRLGAGVKFYLRATAATLPAPFNGLTEFKTFDPALTATCPGSRRCVAYRFRPSGRVSVEPPDPAAPPAVVKRGHALVLGSDLSADYAGADQRGILVAVPSGIVRSFQVPRL